MSFLKRKGEMENSVLEKLCNRKVDVIYETFTKQYYLLTIQKGTYLPNR